MMEDLKKWNWFLFFVILFCSLIASLGNKHFLYLFDKIMFGLIIGLAMGLLLAFLTKEN